MDVLKGQDLLILVDLLGRDLPGHEFAEDALFSQLPPP
jgi:hypothetical protein